jgi:alkylhydroperoxidase/carboxymuconolactone decarboxylase family protein YurZ
MQAQTSQDAADERDHKKNQRALLALALYEFPDHLTWKMLGGRIAVGDSLDRAVRELITVGLIFCEGDTLLPTLAARHFDWLELP